jgi:hypothetical protein
VTGRPVRADFELWWRTCPDCRKPIMWARVGKDRDEWMPLDAEPVPSGNVLAQPDPTAPRRLIADVLGRPAARAAMVADGWLLFQHHRLSCPFADKWARQNKSMRPGPTGVRPAPAVDTLPDPEGLFDV